MLVICIDEAEATGTDVAIDDDVRWYPLSCATAGLYPWLWSLGRGPTLQYWVTAGISPKCWLQVFDIYSLEPGPTRV